MPINKGFTPYMDHLIMSVLNEKVVEIWRMIA